MIGLDSVFITNIRVIIQHEYNIKVTVEKLSFSPENPYDSFLVIHWKNGKEKCQVKIPEDKIGPARVKDLMDLFGVQIRDNYPEMFL